MKRDTFLSNIQQSLQKTHLPNAYPQRSVAPELPSFEPEQVVAQFTQEATALQSKVHLAESEEAAFKYILDIFAQHQATDFIAWASEYIPLPKLTAGLREQGFAHRPSEIPRNEAERRDSPASLSAVAIGLTGALAGLADTGSLVLQSGPGRGRLASLLPPVHIAALSSDELFPTMAHFLRANPDAARDASNLVFISGPSRTADIEQILTLGVHGPKELHIILV